MADNITVSIQHRAEGYLLRLSIPQNLVQHLGDQGHWAEHLTETVRLDGLPHADDFDAPRLVRIEIDVLPDE